MFRCTLQINKKCEAFVSFEQNTQQIIIVASIKLACWWIINPLIIFGEKCCLLTIFVFDLNPEFDFY